MLERRVQGASASGSSGMAMSICFEYARLHMYYAQFRTGKLNEDMSWQHAVRRDEYQAACRRRGGRLDGLVNGLGRVNLDDDLTTDAKKRTLPDGSTEYVDDNGKVFMIRRRDGTVIEYDVEEEEELPHKTRTDVASVAAAAASAAVAAVSASPGPVIMIDDDPDKTEDEDEDDLPLSSLVARAPRRKPDRATLINNIIKDLKKLHAAGRNEGQRRVPKDINDAEKALVIEAVAPLGGRLIFGKSIVSYEFPRSGSVPAAAAAAASAVSLVQAVQQDPRAAQAVVKALSPSHPPPQVAAVQAVKHPVAAPQQMAAEAIVYHIIDDEDPGASPVLPNDDDARFKRALDGLKLELDIRSRQEVQYNGEYWGPVEISQKFGMEFDKHDFPGGIAQIQRVANPFAEFSSNARRVYVLFYNANRRVPNPTIGVVFLTILPHTLTDHIRRKVVQFRNGHHIANRDVLYHNLPEYAMSHNSSIPPKPVALAIVKELTKAHAAGVRKGTRVVKSYKDLDDNDHTYLREQLANLPYDYHFIRSELTYFIPADRDSSSSSSAGPPSFAELKVAAAEQQANTSQIAAAAASAAVAAVQQAQTTMADEDEEDNPYNREWVRHNNERMAAMGVVSSPSASSPQSSGSSSSSAAVAAAAASAAVAAVQQSTHLSGSSSSAGSNAAVAAAAASAAIAAVQQSSGGDGDLLRKFVQLFDKSQQWPGGSGAFVYPGSLSEADFEYLRGFLKPKGAIFGPTGKTKAGHTVIGWTGRFGLAKFMREQGIPRDLPPGFAEAEAELNASSDQDFALTYSFQLKLALQKLFPGYGDYPSYTNEDELFNQGLHGRTTLAMAERAPAVTQFALNLALDEGVIIILYRHPDKRFMAFVYWTFDVEDPSSRARAASEATAWLDEGDRRSKVIAHNIPSGQNIAAVAAAAASAAVAAVQQSSAAAHKHPARYGKLSTVETDKFYEILHGFLNKSVYEDGGLSYVTKELPSGDSEKVWEELRALFGQGMGTDGADEPDSETFIYETDNPEEFKQRVRKFLGQV